MLRRTVCDIVFLDRSVSKAVSLTVLGVTMALVTGLWRRLEWIRVICADGTVRTVGAAMASNVRRADGHTGAFL